MLLLQSCKKDSVEPDPTPTPFELWVTDQAQHTITVFDGETMEVKTVIDLEPEGGLKPHMCVFSPDYQFGYVACVGGEGATVVIRTRDYKPIATLPTGKSSHASIPTFDGSRVWVSVIGEKKLREFTVDAQNETFTITRELDLDAELPDTNAFPSNKPICHMFTLDDKACYVTLGGGGLAVVDVATMKVIKSYPVDQIAPAGCGLINGPAGSNLMFANSGTQTTGNFYIFNTQTHELIDAIDTGDGGDDAHGVALTPDGKELWLVNRHSDNIMIFDMAAMKFVHTIENIGDTPDLIVISPDGTRAYVTLRGAAQTGPHANSGTEPGIAVIDVVNRKPLQIVRMGTPEEVDPHGINLLPGR